jgi:asparagine synthase (glutamine-hydrolysing)
LSGIVGIFRRNNAPVERAVLQSLTEYLSYRGPEAQSVWSDGCAGFGHTMLRTSCEADAEIQPASLQDRVWITADVRLDSRAELIRDLDQAGCHLARLASDPELILHAYQCWGENCVDHLRGDFAFAIWDARNRQVFCARDHFGNKPFYYVVNESLFLFSNTLNCLRIHPEVSEELNEAAIGDFLLFGLNCDVATTTFRDIQRLPPAHSLVISADAFRMRRYWSPPIDGCIRYKHPEEYVERFREILKESVADRLRTSPVGIYLSGGLDSGSIAAMAREISTSSRGSKDLRAYTMIYESLFRDEEIVFARETADRAQIPIQYLPADKFQPFDRWEESQALLPEPVETPFVFDIFETFRAIGSDCRVVLSGNGADNLMDFQMWPHAKDLFRKHEWPTLASELIRFLWVRPFPWRGLVQRARKMARSNDAQAGLPNWIAADFAKRMDLAERWKRFPFLGSLVHPVLPRGHASMFLPQWTHLLENGDPGVTHSPVEIRFPFLDLRMVDYLLALPPFPWFFKKRLLRQAMAGMLPKSTLTRPKTPLPIHPVAEALKSQSSTWVRKADLCPEMRRYVVTAEALPVGQAKNPEQAYVMIRPLCLNFWLQSLKRVRYNLSMEVPNA